MFAGGRRKGGRWLLIDHGKITLPQLLASLNDDKTQTEEKAEKTEKTETKDTHNTHNTRDEPEFAVFRFEGFILHCECATLEAAVAFLHVAIACGFKESGLVVSHTQTETDDKQTTHTTHTAPRFMVQIRNSIRLESPVAQKQKQRNTHTDSTAVQTQLQAQQQTQQPTQQQAQTQWQWLVSEDYLRMLVDMANTKFDDNAKRVFCVSFVCVVFCVFRCVGFDYVVCLLCYVVFVCVLVLSLMFVVCRCGCVV